MVQKWLHCTLLWCPGYPARAQPEYVVSSSAAPSSWKSGHVVGEIVSFHLSLKGEGRDFEEGMELESPRWTSEALLLSFGNIVVSQQNMSTSAKPLYLLFSGILFKPQ